MKYLTTEKPHERLVAEVDEETGAPSLTISNVPLKVSNDAADRYAKLGEDLGVRLVVSDDPSELEQPVTTDPTPDLSAGVPAITGHGDAVTDAQARGEAPPAAQAAQTTTTRKRSS